MIKDLKAVSLVDILPDNLLADTQVYAAAKALDDELQRVTAATWEALHLPRLDELPEAVLDLLAWQWHVDFYEPMGMSVETKRSLIRKSIAWHRMKGTPAAVEEVVTAAFDEATVSEWFEYGGEPFFFRVTTEDATTNTQAIDAMRRSIETVKNVRSVLESIQFIIHNSDKYGGIQDELSFRAEHNMTENYPWNYQKYDGSIAYARIATYSGEFHYTGSMNYNMGIPGTRKYNAIDIDRMGVIDVNLNDLRDDYQTIGKYDGKNSYNGTMVYSDNHGPRDLGGEITIKRGLTYDGTHTYGSGWARYTGSISYDGSCKYNGGDFRRYKVTERNETF